MVQFGPRAACALGVSRADHRPSRGHPLRHYTNQPTFRRRVDNDPPLVPILSQVHPV